MPTEQEMVADGWVRLGREGDRLTTVARKAFGQWLSWRVRDAAGAVWAQPRPEYLQAPTPLFSYCSIADAANFRDSVVYEPIRQHVQSEIARDIAKVLAPFSDEQVREFMDEIEDMEWWRACQRVQMLLFNCEPGHRAVLLREWIAPWFFRKFPDGRIDFVVASETYRSHTYLVRKLYELWGIPDVSLEEIYRLPADTLTALHGFDQQFFPILELGIAFGFFYPYIYGFSAQQVTSAILFHFGQSLEATAPYPQSFEHWWRDSSAFDERDAHVWRLQAIARGGRGDRRLFIQTWSAAEWQVFFDWYLAGLERLYQRVLDFRVFTARTGEIDYRRQFKTMLTLFRIALGTQLLVSGFPPFIRKTLAFDLIEQVGVLLAGRDSSAGDQARLFSEMLTDGWRRRWLSPVLSRIPPPFGEVFNGASAQVWTDVMSSVLDGIFMPPKRPQPGEEEDTFRQVIRQLRNTRHGYFLEKERFESYLAAHTGNLSDWFPHVCLFLWLAFLQEPRLFIQEEANNPGPRR